MIRSYQDLRRLKTFEDRFEYLKLSGSVGNSTFGFDRYLNQIFYKSIEWRRTRDQIIIRDSGCDLGIPGREIFSLIVVHHINLITLEDIENRDPIIYDHNNLICTSNNTHQAIHYGNILSLQTLPKDRREGDTNLWDRS